MEINLDLHDRNLDFKLTGATADISGSGLDAFLVILQKYGKIIKRLNFSGQSGFYTFSRQVYLALNLFKVFSEGDVFLEGRKINREEILLPKYEKKNDLEEN